MIKFFKPKIWLSIIIAIFIGLNSFALEDLYAIATSSPYDNDKLSLHEVQKLYHKRVNDIFNSKLVLLTQGEKGPGISKIPDGDECEENNYSTYCLALSVAKEYEQYQASLLKRKGYVKADEETLSNIQTAATKIIQQQGIIDQEILKARKALDTALQTYNELRIAYPMHLQYEETIKNLTKYNKKLSELRKETEVLPRKFIDATTTQCT